MKNLSKVQIFGFGLTIGSSLFLSGCNSEPSSDELYNDVMNGYLNCVNDTQKLRDMDMVFGGWTDSDIADYCAAEGN